MTNSEILLRDCDAFDHDSEDDEIVLTPWSANHWGPDVQQVDNTQCVLYQPVPGKETIHLRSASAAKSVVQVAAKSVHANCIVVFRKMRCVFRHSTEAPSHLSV